MAVTLQSLLDASTKNLAGVHPRVKEYALELVRQSYAKGINVLITSGLRSMTAQAKLYGQGRTSYIYNGVQYGNPKLPVVTQAPPGHSIHNFGLAIDYALRTDSGQIVWDLSRDSNANGVQDWFEVAAIGKKLGFAWGGDWKSFKDYPHLDFQKGISLASLRAGARPTIPPLAPKTWLEMGDSGADVLQLQKDFNYIGIKVDVDGIFGKGMDAAVKAFQRDKKITVDGQVGTGTRKYLDAAVVAKEKEIAKKEAEAAAVKYPTYPTAAKDRLGEVIVTTETKYRRLPDNKSEVISTLKKGHTAHYYDVWNDFTRLGTGWVMSSTVKITKNYKDEAAKKKAQEEAKAKAEAEAKAKLPKLAGSANTVAWQQLEMAAIFKKAHEQGIFDSDEHSKAIEAGTMTMEKAVYLLAVIAGANLNGGKRIQ